jgi:hypothetical protein
MGNVVTFGTANALKVQIAVTAVSITKKSSSKNN